MKKIHPSKISYYARNKRFFLSNARYKSMYRIKTKPTFTNAFFNTLIKEECSNFLKESGEHIKKENPEEAQGLLSQKLDTMLKEAKIDGQLMESLGNSIKNFEAASKTIAPTAESLASTKKYSDELTLAATQMESINALYKIQLDSASKTTQLNEEVAENSVKLNQQMQSLTSNLSSLNNVYGGMLSAMSNK